MRKIVHAFWHSRSPSSPLHTHATTVQKIVTAQMIRTVTSPIHVQCPTLYSTHPPSSEESMIRRGWRKTATLISAFMTGTKSLYKDVKVMYELKRRHRLVITGAAPREMGSGTTDLVFTREELQFLYHTQRDLRKMLPTIALFFVPFFGYIVPFIVFMYPHQMLSHHFLTEQQKTDILTAASKTRHQHLHSLLSSDICQDSCELWRQLKTSVHNVGREDVESESQDVITTSDLKQIKSQHLERLCGMWGVSGGLLSRLVPWLGASSLRSRLQSHLHYIYTVDWLVKVEGGPSRLQNKDVEKLCMERCLLVSEEEDKEEYLHRWIQISTQFKECPPYLMAHLPLLLCSSAQREH